MAQEPKLLKDWSAEVKVAVPAITEPAYKEVPFMVYQCHRFLFRFCVCRDCVRTAAVRVFVVSLDCSNSVCARHARSIRGLYVHYCIMFTYLF